MADAQFERAVRLGSSGRVRVHLGGSCDALPGPAHDAIPTVVLASESGPDSSRARLAGVSRTGTLGVKFKLAALLARRETHWQSLSGVRVAVSRPAFLLAR